MNNGQYTLHAINTDEISSAGLVEFPTGTGDQKVLVFSGIALPEMGTNDDDDIGHPRVFVRLGRFVRRLLSTSVTTGLASISNDESGFVLATDGVVVQRDMHTGELFLDIPCGLAGDGTYIHRIAYQAVCIVEEDQFRIRGEIVWTPDVRDSSHDSAASIGGMLAIRSGRLVSAAPSNPGPGQFGTTKWQAFSNGSITGITRRGDGWVASYEIVNLPVATPVHVVIDVLAGFARTENISASRSGGPDPVFLSGAQPHADNVNFRLQFLQGVR
jgi:hypothetical protein